jgi:hypothetical protein
MELTDEPKRHRRKFSCTAGDRRRNAAGVRRRTRFTGTMKITLDKTEGAVSISRSPEVSTAIGRLLAR